MKCILCGTEAKSTPVETGFTDKKKQAAAEAEANAQAEQLSKWEHLRVTITRNGGQLEILAGDICPKELVKVGDLKVVR